MKNPYIHHRLRGYVAEEDLVMWKATGGEVGLKSAKQKLPAELLSCVRNWKRRWTAKVLPKGCRILVLTGRSGV